MVDLHVVLVAMHGDGPLRGDGRADRVRALGLLAPVHAGHQGHAVGLFQKVVVAHGVQHRALGRGQQHHAVRVGDLAVQRLHDRHRVLEEKTVFFQRALQLRDGQAGVVGAVIGRYAKRFGAQVRLVDERSGIHVRRCRLRHVGLLDQRAVHVVS